MGVPTISHVPKIGIHSIKLLSVLKEWIPRQVNLRGADTLAQDLPLLCTLGETMLFFIYFLFSSLGADGVK